MSIDFNLKDVLHSIVAQFRRCTLPSAKKPYNLYAIEQPVLDIHGIASKAEAYNITTSPKVIEEGFTAAIELIYYLAADGYKINTPLFDLHIRIPGEYDGTETHLPQGVHAEPSISVSPEFRRYTATKVEVSIHGFDELEGHIASVTDLATSATDSITRSSAIAIEGIGIKIVSEPTRMQQCGLFFVNEADPSDRQRCDIVIDNTPRRLSAQTPASLQAGSKYFVEIVTQSSVRNGSQLLKGMRTVRSDTPYTAL